MSGLRIAPDAELPVAVAGEAIAILAKRGAGKTNTGRVLAEELVRADVQTIVLDPVGAWWGLRSSADGKGEGLALPILGGAHGDVPLQPAAGALIADVVVDTGQSLLIDLSDFSKTEQRRFVTDFAERLYTRKARSPQLVHLILEEADEFAPQRVSAGDARMVGAIEALVRRGRGRGIGLTMITQRSASLNKSVLEQADLLILMRTTGPRDRAAVEAWVSKQDVDGAELVMPSLPGLATGEAWIWNPEHEILQRVRIRLARTFDSSQTPKAGVRRAEPARRAVDLTKLGAEIEKTAERAKENDPAELRKQLRDIQRRLDAAEHRATLLERAVPEKIVETVEVPVLNGELPALRDAISAMDDIASRLVTTGELVHGAASAIATAITAAASRAETTALSRERVAARPRQEASQAEPAARPSARAAAAPATYGPGEVKLGKGERTVLGVLAEYPEGRTQNELAFLAGYSAKASTIGVILGTLRRAGLVEPGQPIRASEAGLEEAGGVRERPVGQELLEQWLRHPRMGEGERRVLLALIERYPEAPSNKALAELTGYSPTASTLGVILSKLRKLGLVEKGARRVEREFMEAIQ